MQKLPFVVVSWFIKNAFEERFLFSLKRIIQKQRIIET